MSFSSDFLKAIDFVIDAAFKNEKVGAAAYRPARIIEDEILKDSKLSNNEESNNELEASGTEA